MNTRLSDHDIKHNLMVSTIQDYFCQFLKAESFIDSDIFAGATLDVTGFILRVSLQTHK